MPGANAVAEREAAAVLAGAMAEEQVGAQAGREDEAKAA